MSEISRFNPGMPNHVPSPRATGVQPAPAPKGYRESEDVIMRAGVSNEEESPENLRSLQRLDRALNGDQPMRGDVPRGFYLNLRV